MIREYLDSDYDKLKELYLHPEWFGGQFDEARDSRKKLASKISEDPESIWVYESNNSLIGSVSIIDDGRVAWLFRFVVKGNDLDIAKELYDKALSVLKTRGHTQVIVYSPSSDQALAKRYTELGMKLGNNYSAYWAEIS